MDALSFMLGEKSSKLRVKKLEELIHGSGNISSVAKCASVEGTFMAVNNDTAEEEILIFSRTIKHTSSIFCFNNKIVPKEEYVGKLKEYGMNVEFPNFLVYQSSIERIAHQNPVELRRYFEYIAGSSDLVKQYEELCDENKILSVESQTLLTQKNNMNKVLKAAMGSVVEYNVYLESKNQYDDKVILKELICLYYLDKSIKGLKETTENKKVENRHLSEELETVKRDLAEKRKHQKEESKIVTDADETIQDRRADLNKMKLHVLKAKESVNNTTKKVSDCKQRIEQNDEDIAGSDNIIKEILTNIKRAERTQKEQKRMRAFTEEQKHRYLLLKDQAAAIHGKNYNLHKAEREYRDFNDNIDTLQAEFKILENHTKLKEDREKLLLNRLDTLRKQETERIDKLTSDKQNVNRDDNAARNLNETIKAVETRLNEEENVRVNIEEQKRDERRQNVLTELKNIFSGVFDRVFNCCKVNQNKYKIPLTKVIGMKNMNAIIVDSEVTAQKCIRYLRNYKYPPETFLPIHFVKVRQYKRINISTTSSVVLLKDVLIYEAIYEKIMAFICKGTYVCENEAMLMNLYEQKINVVNLEGSYYQSSGLISGGVVDLVRKARHWSTQDESEQENRYVELTEQHRNLQQQLVQIQRRKHDVTNAIPVDETIVKVIMDDIRETEKEVANLDQELSTQKNDLQKLTEQIASLKAKVSEREPIIEEIRKNESVIFNDFCRELKIKNIAEFENLDKIDQQKTDIDKELDQLQIKLEYYKEMREKMKKNKSDLEKQLLELEKQLKALMKNQEGYSKNLLETSIIVDDFKKNRETKLNSLQEVDSTAREIDKKYKELLKNFEMAQINHKKTQDDIELLIKEFNSLYTNCKTEGIEIPSDEHEPSQDIEMDPYNHVIIDYNQIPEEYIGYSSIRDKKFRKLLDKIVEDIETLRIKIETGSRYLSKHGKGRNEQIEALRDKYQAIENQYGEVITRYHNVTQQIKHCAKERNDRLIKLLNGMKTIIKPMYSDLTGDTTGNVFLEFQNAENPLKGGISYNVIAPEKSLMPMDSLSGGEITMAGILLLLAIQKHSRCPILILDEIDAPLDPTNAVKLFKYLGKISADLQTFLITHNTEIYPQVQLLLGFTKNFAKEITLNSKVVMLSCDKYEQVSHEIMQESDVSI